jgi:outer membrane autotransporter protein
MQFRAHLVSLAGGQRSDGRAVGTKLELGQSWKLGNGLTVAPQLRYTDTRVDGLSVQGYQATFNSRDTHWQRASAGVALQKTFVSPSGWQWTPYGEANVVDTLNGVTDYAINQDYFGQVMTKGMSTQVKFGVGARKGELSFNGGVNWLGGGNNVTGGFGAQMTLQYAW